MILRSGGQDDAAAIAAVHSASWRTAYAHILDSEFLAGPIEQDHLTAWTGRMARPAAGQSVLLALDNETCVGFVCSVLDDDPHWGSRIDNLHVGPGHRGAGLGERLLRRAAADIAAARPGAGLYLWVFEANLGGRRFYERLGAVEVERNISLIPSAHGKPVLRLHWPEVELLARS